MSHFLPPPLISYFLFSSPSILSFSLAIPIWRTVGQPVSTGAENYFWGENFHWSVPTKYKRIMYLGLAFGVSSYWWPSTAVWHTRRRTPIEVLPWSINKRSDSADRSGYAVLAIKLGQCRGHNKQIILSAHDCMRARCALRQWKSRIDGQAYGNLPVQMNIQRK